MRKLFVLFILVLVIVLVGCRNKDRTDNMHNDETIGTTDSIGNISQENEKTGDRTKMQSGIESNYPEELIKVNEFMDYYKIQDTDIPVDYIESFIRDKQLTKDMLGERNYDQMLIKMYERGVTFGTKIVDLIQGEVISLSDNDDFSDVAYIVLSKEQYLDGTDTSVEENDILEVENQKMYITSQTVNEDYTTSENVRALSGESIREYVQQLRSIITDEWQQYHHIENKECSWKLYIVKEEGCLIYYEGESVDEMNHPGFEDWCKNLGL